jgi:hypothetical protein
MIVACYARNRRRASAPTHPLVEAARHPAVQHVQHAGHDKALGRARGHKHQR